ncbi:MAG TPA: phosphoribosylpyrophosphate synthetase [Chryseolinea sp.]
MKWNYTSLSEATRGLKARGYTYDFNLKSDRVESPAFQIKLTPENFMVEEFHRFEGMSSTDDNSIVYAISSKEGLKGILVDAYGVYASSLSDEMIRKLSINR